MKHKKFTIFIAMFLMILLALPMSAKAVTQAEIDRLQQERDELAEKQQETQEKIDELKDQKASVIEQKEALDRRNTLALQQLELIGHQIELYTRLVGEKEQEVAQAKSVEEEQMQLYRVRVRAMEENGGYDVVSLLFHAGSFTEFLTAIDDIGEIMQADRELEEAYRTARINHEKALGEYEAAKADLKDREEELLSEQEELKRMIREATDLIADLDLSIEEAQKEYEEAERAREAADARIEELIEALRREREKPKPTPTPKPTATPKPTPAPEATPAPTQTDPPETPAPGESPSPEETPAPTQTDPPETPAPEATPEPEETEAPEETTPPGIVGTGTLIWPVPCSHTVTSRFGMRIDPFTGEEKYHSGIDIDGYGNDGGAIVACDGGVVVTAEWYGGYGNCIIIDHGNGMQTLYGHMSGYAVSAGDTVTQGQTIGYLGSTGWSTGTHCHLEVFVDGGRVDPAGYFSGITYYDC